MKPIARSLVLIATVIPCLGFVAFITALLTDQRSVRELIQAQMALQQTGAAFGTSPTPTAFPLWAFIFLLSVLWMAFLYIYYIVHISRTSALQMPEERKWVLVILLGHVLWPLNMPFMFYYWGKYMQTEKGMEPDSTPLEFST